ncbi:MAG TPA: 1-acyl-sn-glycerol-3-phosphate acyltransferase [Pirellulales bacterium]|nr:1-acyl-sn-glycerol-3-phosphate acyltransferase [Pirellulales bacterium]
MQEVVNEQPYRFVPPYHGRVWWSLLEQGLPWYLSRYWGVERVELRGIEHVHESLAAGHGILLAANHPRPSDPIVLGVLSRKLRQPFFTMASWHLFMNGGWQAWFMHKLGGFSVYREGVDRAAVNAAVDILVSGERPLLIFPEGTVSRTNDRLSPLLEGTAFIARTAAKRREKAGMGRVVLHPVVIRYRYHGEVRLAVEPVLNEIEARLTWRPVPERQLIERIVKVGEALLTLKELEHLGHPQTGALGERLKRLIDHLLVPLERQWLTGDGETNTVVRVKRLRSAIVPTLTSGELSEVDKQHRWRQLADCYLAQQLSCYPPDYLGEDPKPERILETVERFEEDITDQARIHRPLGALVEVGEAVPIPVQRDRGSSGDDLLEAIESRLRAMIAAV